MIYKDKQSKNNKNWRGIKMMPSLFIAHGAPLLAIENNDYTKFLNQLGQNLPRPKAIVCFLPIGNPNFNR